MLEVTLIQKQGKQQLPMISETLQEQKTLQRAERTEKL